MNDWGICPGYSLTFRAMVQKGWRRGPGNTFTTPEGEEVRMELLEDYWGSPLEQVWEVVQVLSRARKPKAEEAYRA